MEFKDKLRCNHHAQRGQQLAGTTLLEPATSAETRHRTNQLNYVPTRQINEMRNRQCLCGFAQIAYRACSCLCCLKERDSCPNRPQTAYKFLSELPYCPGRSAPMARKKTQGNEPRKNILTA